MTTPPYLRIADEIRRRIASGQLREGDRLPSARQITHDWGVAIATATKVHAVLRRAGLARPVPGVGTVVAAPRPGAVAGRRTRGGTAETDLGREAIVRAAIRVADGEGLDALSMRRVAAELGVATMSLYRHVPGKDELLLLMADAVYADHDLPPAPPNDWREALELHARTQWAMYRSHPWIARVVSFTRPMLAPNGMAHTEWTMRALDGLGLDVATRLYVVLCVFGYVHGTAVNLESEVEAQHDTGVTSDEWMAAQESAFQAIMASGRFPMLAAVAELPGFDVELDTLFDLGLGMILDGLATFLDRRAGLGGGTPARPGP